MTNIKQLILDLCPHGVDFKRLGEVAEIDTGSRNRQDAVENGKYPFYVRSKEIFRSDTYSFNEEAIIIPGEGGIGDIFHYVNGKYDLHQRAYRIHFTTNKVNTKFVYFYLTAYFKEYILGKAFAATATSIRKPMLQAFPIPIPSLEIQEKIVECLDKFSALAAELQAELQKRRTQYEYYRTRLLTPPQTISPEGSTDERNWKWKTLGEIGTFVRGNGLQKKDFTDDGVGCIHYGQIYTRLGTFCKEPLTRVPEDLAKKLVKVYPGNLVIACTSENVEDCCKSVAWLGEETIVTGGHAAVFRHNENPKYIAYAFQSEIFQKQKNKFAKGVKVIDIKIEELSRISIPLPSLAEQERIVSILDKFEALTNSLSEGIPAEQAAQQKRYEYYRDLLLTFKKRTV